MSTNTSTLSLSRRLSRMLIRAGIVRSDIERMNYYVLDWLGSYTAGGATPAGKALLSYHNSGAVIPGGSLESDVFLSAALSHITETDDLHRSSVTHPACVVIPVALYLSRHLELTGKMALEGMVVGYEAMIRIGDALGPSHYTIFHNTATAGVFGAAATAAYLLQLNEDQWVWALGNAGTQAAGLWQFNADAAMTKPLHAGHAAQSGLRAALLAFHGFTGTEHIFEGDKGFFRGYCPDPNPAAIIAPPGPWRFPETSIKPYPSCRHTHPAIDAALTLRKDLEASGMTASDIDSILIETYSTALRVTDNATPDSTYAAKFSIQYCLCSALAEGVPTLTHFEGDYLRRDTVHRLIQRTKTAIDPQIDRKYPSSWGARLSLGLSDGSTLEKTIDTASGDPEKPLSAEELEVKVKAQFAYAGIPEAEAIAWLKQFNVLPDAEDLSDLYWNLPQKTST